MIDFDHKTLEKPQDLEKFWKIVHKLFKIKISENKNRMIQIGRCELDGLLRIQSPWIPSIPQ